MQTPFREPTPAATFFSRERRRQRMRNFLEAFEHGAWRRPSEISFLFPFTKSEMRESACANDSRSPLTHL